MSNKLAAGSPLPELELSLAGGGKVRLGGSRDGWQLIVVYRGRHCPICKKYLGRLEELVADFEALGAEVVAVSGDSGDKAEAEKAELGLTFAVAYDLDPGQMRTLGLYISEPRSAKETDRLYPEPALFVVNPAGKVHIVDVSNAPFARPHLDGVLSGLRYIQENDYPIRGTAG